MTEAMTIPAIANAVGAEGAPHLPSIYWLRRRFLEQWIEWAIALLDEIDGDENMEPYLADTHPKWADREDDRAEDGIADEGALALVYFTAHTL